MAIFKINKNCEGCGLCAAQSQSDNIIVQYDNSGYLRAQINNADSESIEGTYSCPLEVEPDLISVIERHVAYHKQVNRRMEGSAGSVFIALLETVVKEGYYFSGTQYNSDLTVSHVVTNDPERIISLAGYKPVQSDCSKVYPTIKELLSKGEKVLFCGTPLQCQALRMYIGEAEGLIVVDSILTGAISQKLFEKYVSEKSAEYGALVTDVRFCNKEFSCLNSKRFTVANGRVFFTKEDDAYDRLVKEGIFTKKINSRDTYKSLEKRIGDISIGQYLPETGWADQLGYTYVSANTDKGKALWEKAKKRVEIVKSGDDIRNNNIVRAYHSFKDNDYKLLETKSLAELAESTQKKGFLISVKNELRFWKGLYLHIKRISQLKPRALFQFVKYNFLTKGINTDYRRHGLIFIAPYSALSLDKGAEIELHGPLEIGVKRVQSSHLETRLWMKPQSKILVHEKGMFGYGSNVEVYKGGVLEIGNLFSNAELTIICGKHIKFGNTVNIAKGCTIRDTNGHVVATPGFKQLRPVELGNHTWVCSNSTIMPGVKLGDGAIVGSNSYVSSSVKSFTLVQGNPAVEQSKPQYFRI